MSELKPCPFCGLIRGDLMRRPDEDGEGWREGYFIGCGCCGTFAPTRPTKTEAVSAWNHRPLEDELVAALAKARKEGTE